MVTAPSVCSLSLTLTLSKTKSARRLFSCYSLSVFASLKKEEEEDGKKREFRVTSYIYKFKFKFQFQFHSIQLTQLSYDYHLPPILLAMLSHASSKDIDEKDLADLFQEQGQWNEKEECRLAVVPRNVIKVVGQ